MLRFLAQTWVLDWRVDSGTWPSMSSTFFCPTYCKTLKKKWVWPERALMLLFRFWEEVSIIQFFPSTRGGSVGASVCVYDDAMGWRLFHSCRLPSWACPSGISTSTLPWGARYYRRPVRFRLALYKEKQSEEFVTLLPLHPPFLVVLLLLRLVPVSVSLPSSVVSS